MVRVAVERASDGRITAFSVQGHAGAGRRGQDIVCAAVSVLSQTAILGLEQRLGLEVGVRSAAGQLACRLPAGLEPALLGRAQDILETMWLGLTEIAAQYPARIVLVPAAAVGRGTL